LIGGKWTKFTKNFVFCNFKGRSCNQV
jgi:hypothetical protein